MVSLASKALLPTGQFKPSTVILFNGFYFRIECAIIEKMSETDKNLFSFFRLIARSLARSIAPDANNIERVHENEM